MGAWIETFWKVSGDRRNLVGPFLGAWIETFWKVSGDRRNLVVPFVGAWIETDHFDGSAV